MSHPPVSLSRTRKHASHGSASERLNILTLACLLTVALAPALAQSPITLQYVYDDLNQLTKVIDSTGIVLKYVYDPVGNILAINRSTITPGALTIFNITPLNAPTGTTITIQGQGFSTTSSANIVTLNGIALTVVSSTSTSLVVQIPANATTGTISITVSGATITSSSPETILPAPTITSVKPQVMQGATTAAVTVSDANFIDTTLSIPAYGTIVAGAAPMREDTAAVPT